MIVSRPAYELVAVVTAHAQLQNGTAFRYEPEGLLFTAYLPYLGGMILYFLTFMMSSFTSAADLKNRGDNARKTAENTAINILMPSSSGSIA